MNTFRWKILAGLVLMLLCRPVVADDQRLFLDKMWLGATSDELKAAGLEGSAGTSTTGAPMLIYGPGTIARFDNGRADLLFGLELVFEGKIIVREGWSPTQVEESFKELGWQKDAEKLVKTDVSGLTFTAWRYISADQQVVLIPFSGQEGMVGGVVLRTITAEGPFGKF